MDEDKTKKRIKPENVTGKIEFVNVWFRYPTRKEDFVLRGLVSQSTLMSPLPLLGNQDVERVPSSTF
jgi:hypothetical protein